MNPRFPGYVRPAGQVPPAFLHPTVPNLSADLCASNFETFYSANAADYATRDLAKAAFAVSSPECAAWATGTSAPPPTTLTPTQCSTYWDAWSSANQRSYTDKNAALAAFAGVYPACAAWARTQAAAIQPAPPTGPVGPVHPVTPPMSTGTKVAIAVVAVAALGGIYLFATKKTPPPQSNPSSRHYPSSTTFRPTHYIDRHNKPQILVQKFQGEDGWFDLYTREEIENEDVAKWTMAPWGELAYGSKYAGGVLREL